MAMTATSNTSSTTPFPPATPYASSSLYVGDLQQDVTEALLFEIFNAVGPVQSVRVCRDAATRRSLGYAYVNFHRVDDAERALDTMNFKNIRQRPCRIMWSHRDPSLRKSGLGNIFVNHLAKSIDNKQLYDTFSMFGNILSCKVAMNAKRESLGYGFVHYESAESAEQAIQRVDGKVIAGEKVRVEAFKAKKERGGSKQFKYTNIFVKNLPAEMTKEQMEDLFRVYGEITSSVISVDKETKSRAFGFINFATAEQATAAVDGANNMEIEGKKLYVSRAQKKDEREKELRERFEQLKQERQKKYAGVNLFVKNLADDMDDAKLTGEFSKFGQITSAKIMRDPAGKSRGFGFVCFSTPEEATKAVTESNGRMLDGKPLYVALAQRKEVRRQQLEAQYAQRAKMGPGIGGGIGGLGGVGGPGYPSQAAIQAAAVGLYGQPPNMMNFPPSLPPQGGRFMYGQQGIPGVGPMVNMGGLGGPQGFPRFNPAAAGMMQGGVGGQRGAPQGQMNGAGGMNYPLMAMAGAGQRQLPMPQQPGGPTANLQQQQLLAQQQRPQPGQVPPQQRGAPQRPAVPPQVGQPPRNGAPAALIGKPVPPHILAQQQAQAGIRYADNVRNPRAAAPPSAQSPSDVVVMPSPSEPLTIKALAAAPEEMRKQMIGERLFPLIKMQEPTLAGKITGMLLEMDNGELIHLLESHAALNEKISEALQVLQQHPGMDGEGGEEETDK
jgi:polyadenylate-binding protein